jgi:hypothetical protein
MSLDARTRTMDLIAGCWTTQAIHAAVKLGIVDALAGGPATAAALASKLDLDPRATYRLLRALAGLGICEHSGGDDFALADGGRLLTADAPGSLRAFTLHWGERTWAAFGQLDTTIRTGAADPRLGARALLLARRAARRGAHVPPVDGRRDASRCGRDRRRHAMSARHVTRSTWVAAWARCSPRC